MKKSPLFLIATAALFLPPSLQAATLVPTVGGGGTMDWEQKDATSGDFNGWRIGGTVQTRTPTGGATGDLAIINSGRTVQVTTNVAAQAGEVRLNNTNGSGTQGNLEILSGGVLVTELLRSTGSDGGNLFLRGTGSLTTAAAQINENSSFNIFGAAAAMSTTSFQVDAAGTLNYMFGTSGVTSIANSGAYTLSTGAKLNVDGSAFTGTAGEYALFSAASRANASIEFVESITGFTGFNTDVVYSATGASLVLTAIPEPSVMALAGLGLAGFVLRRRRA